MSKVKTEIIEPKTNVTGEVTLIKRKGNLVVSKKVMHNNAVSNLLIGIARYIRGDFLNLPAEGKSFIPAYLGLGYTEQSDRLNTNFTDTALASELVSSEYRFDVAKGSVSLDEVNSQVSVVLKAVIPTGAFSKGTRINELGLFSQRSITDSGLLARVVYLKDNELATKLNDPDGNYHIVIDNGMSYEIEWKIKLSNGVI